MNIKICIAQINYLRGDFKHHLERIKKIITENRSADLIVFPELLLHGHPSMERPEGLLYRTVEHFYDSMADNSDNLYEFIRQEDARVIIGELQGSPGSFKNVATYIDKKGAASYTKTHVHWTEHFVPGNRLRVFNTPFGRVGINICFDAAFPEVWRVLALKGAKVIVNISAVPRTFPADYMWLRMRSAAFNNQVFVVYANRPGEHFSGRSAVFDPKGDMVASVDDNETVLNTEINLLEVNHWRREENIFSNRRPLLYRDLAKQSGRKRSVRNMVKPLKGRQK